MKKERDENLREEDSRVEVETDNKIVKAQHFIYNNRNLISYVAIAIIAAVVGLYWLTNYMTQESKISSEKAMVALDRIYKYYDAPDYKKALFGDSSATVRGERVIGLLEIIDEYGGTDQAYVASFYAGNSYLALSKADEAMGYFEKASGSSSKLILQGAYSGMGACYELKNDLEQAASYYSKASDLAVDDLAKARLSYYAALCYEKSGDKEKAIELYTHISNKNRYNEFGNFSKAGLSRLGMKID